MKQHKILEDVFNIPRKELLDNQRKWTREDKKNGFSVCETWSLDYAFVCWLLERCHLYIEKGGQIVDLDFNRFNYKDKEYTQRELIDLLIEKCQEYINNDDITIDVWEEINDIWKLIGLAMWW